MKKVLTAVKIIVLSQILVLSLITFVTLEFPLILTETFSNVERVFYLLFSILTALALYMIVHSTKIETKD